MATLDSPRSRLGGSHHPPPYSIFCGWPLNPHPNGFSFPWLPSGSPEIAPIGIPATLEPIILWADFGSRCGLKQSCSSHQELSNDMSHALCNQVNRVESRLFLARSQTGNLTTGLSFGDNLYFKRLNEQCKTILDIYIWRAFQWYKECHKPLNFDPWNRSLKFRESTRTPSPKVGVALGMWGFTPSYSLTFSYTPGSMWCDSRASSWPAPLRPLCLDSRVFSWLVTL